MFRHRDRSRREGLLGRVVQIGGVRPLEFAPTREGHRAILDGKAAEVWLAVWTGEAADEDDLADLGRAGARGEPGQAARRGMPHHHGPPGSRINGREHSGHLIRERRRRIAITLARRGDRHGAMAVSPELGGDVVPDRRAEPQPGDQQDVHLSSPSPL